MQKYVMFYFYKSGQKLSYLFYLYIYCEVLSKIEHPTNGEITSQRLLPGGGLVLSFKHFHFTIWGFGRLGAKNGWVSAVLFELNPI